MKNLVFGILGTLTMLAWWNYGGDANTGFTPEDQSLPSVIAGGGRAIAIALHTSGPVYFSATFACGEAANDSEIHGREELPAGDHRFAFDVSGDCDYAILESGAHAPPIGAELGWTVTVDDRPWQEEHRTLEEPLAPGYGFFLQTGWEDGSLNETLAYRDGV